MATPSNPTIRPANHSNKDNSNLPYFTLAQFDTRRQAWFPQFGSFKRNEVKAELRDYSDHGERKANLAIVVSKVDPASVALAIAAL